MVTEDDPQFARFWNAYPHRVAKKDARIAWVQINPTPEIVDRMVSALAWQAPLWERQGYGTPYPASWLRAERWTDEAPQQGVRALSGKVGDPMQAWLQKKLVG